MRYLEIAFMITTLLLSCNMDNGASKKEFWEPEGEKVEIYLLKSSERMKYSLLVGQLRCKFKFVYETFASFHCRPKRFL